MLYLPVELFVKIPEGTVNKIPSSRRKFYRTARRFFPEEHSGWYSKYFVVQDGFLATVVCDVTLALCCIRSVV